MDNVINKNKNLIEVLESSELIKKLDYYKNKVTSNCDIMNLINRYNNSSDDYEKMDIKRKVYKDEDYNQYMKYYNELFYYVLDINNRFRVYTNGKECSKWEL